MVLMASYLLGAFLSTIPTPSRASELAIENCDFGEVYAFQKTSCEVALINTSNKPIHIWDIKPVRAVDSVKSIKKLVLAPKSKSYLDVGIDVGNAVGNTHSLFRFRTDEKDYVERIAVGSGFVMTVLDQVKPELDFGIVDLTDELPQKSIELSSHENETFKITQILEKPNYLDVAIGTDGRTLQSRLLPTAPWGLHTDYIKLGINTPQQKEAWVLVKTDVHGDVVPASNPFDMGLMRFGNHNEHQIRITSRSGRDYKIGQLELENLKGKVKLMSCEPKAIGCKIIALSISDRQPSGAIKGSIWVTLPEYKQRLPIFVWGLILGKDVKIKTLDSSANQLSDAQFASGAQSENTRPPTDVKQAIKGTIKQANIALPSGNGPLLKWTVAYGAAVHGFQIFRSNNENGPFVLLNKLTIPADADNSESATYQYRDNTAESDKTYWYYIGLVNNDGTKQQLSGPQKIVAK